MKFREVYKMEPTTETAINPAFIMDPEEATTDRLGAKESNISSRNSTHSVNFLGKEAAPIHLEDKPESEESHEKNIFNLFSSAIGQRENSLMTSHKMENLSRRVRMLIAPAIFIGYLLAVIIIHSDIQNEDFWCTGDGLLYIMTIVTAIVLVYYKVIKRYFGKSIHHNCLQPSGKVFSRFWTQRFVKIIFVLVLIVSLLAFLIVDTSDERRRLVSLLGLTFILSCGFIFSIAPLKVRWQHVIWGVSLQFILGLLVLRWPLGNTILQCLADKVSAFLSYAHDGAEFVFGDLTNPPLSVFAFSVLPVTIYFSFFTNILFYYGVLQLIVVKLGWLFQISIGTTLCESMNAAASIFLGMTESPLLIKPYLSKMTKSELHAVMTAGFATIAGSLLAAYISLGVDAALLLTACVMNAPAALAISKLLYPETRTSRINAKLVADVKSNEINALHAGCVGVTNALPLVANIAGNLIAFIAFISFVNAIFDWSCQLVNFEEGTCSLESVLGYIFMPLAWVMGIEWSDCYYVGQLIGIKITVNEFVAYAQLANYMKEGLLSPRSQSIATFAICGFSNIGSMGIMIGGLGPMAPDRKEDMASIVFRAMIAGSMATLSSACIAGVLLSESTYMHYSNGTETTTAFTLSTTTSLP